MVRSQLAFVLLLTIPGPLPGHDDRAKAVAALALASAPPGAGCGVCRTDYPACWQEAARSGRPLVLVVGTPVERCRGPELVATGAIVCRTDRYDHDGRPAASERLIVMSGSPSARTGELSMMVRSTLRPAEPMAEVNRRVGEAAAATGYKLPPKAAGRARLDWK